MPDHLALTHDQRTEIQRILLQVLDDPRVTTEIAEHVSRSFATELEVRSSRPFTLLYTGWRGAARHRVREDLEVVLAKHGRIHVVVGYNPDRRIPTGGDQWTYEWATSTPGVTVETHPAPWHLPEVRKAAGGYRNGFMAGLVVARGGDFGVLAHLHSESKGATGMAAFTAYLGMRVWRQPAT